MALDILDIILDDKKLDILQRKGYKYVYSTCKICCRLNSIYHIIKRKHILTFGQIPHLQKHGRDTRKGNNSIFFSAHYK